MELEEQSIWDRIKAFKLDNVDASFKFSHRLARENGWSIRYSDRVIEEYKKFLFLCCISENGATPSDQVDQVWHLHLTYTRSYWLDLCQNTLKKEIHHNPTNGGNSEARKFDDLYSNTLKLYLEKFGQRAPVDIWPENSERFSDIHFQRVNTKKNWIIRKPQIGGKNTTILLLIFFSFFLVQSSNENAWSVLIILGAGFIIWNIFKDNGNNSGCSGGDSGSDHGSGCNGHSGCSGCSSSGCSGCGGCGGD